MLHRTLPLSLLLLASCAPSTPMSTPAPSPLLDGSIAEWSAESAAWADASHVYVRFKVPADHGAIQNAPRTVALYLDADANPATGRRATAKVFNTLGVDLEIEFSPRNADGSPTPGVAAFAVAADGTRRKIPNEATGLTVSPTYASRWYEARIARAVVGSLALPAEPAAAGGLFVTYDDAGTIDGYSEPFRLPLPPRGPEPKLSTLPPDKDPGLVRIVSWNVQKSAPLTNAAPFARVLTLLEPDVVLFQEWDNPDPDALRSWLEEHVPRSLTPGRGPEGSWRVRSGPGVAVASRWPLENVPPDTLQMTFEQRERTVRMTSALVTTPLAEVLLTSIHLKCCGSATGREEATRQAEAKAINLMLAESSRPWPMSMRVIAGDYNLVGTRTPLDLLAEGLDTDGSNLAVADAATLGDNAVFTWRDWSSPFTPGRLDFALYSDASGKAVHAFVLDTSRMSQETLARLGLDAADSAASDHLPVVLDLLPIPTAR